MKFNIKIGIGMHLAFLVLATVGLQANDNRLDSLKSKGTPMKSVSGELFSLVKDYWQIRLCANPKFYLIAMQPEVKIAFGPEITSIFKRALKREPTALYDSERSKYKTGHPFPGFPSVLMGQGISSGIAIQTLNEENVFGFYNGSFYDSKFGYVWYEPELQKIFDEISEALKLKAAATSGQAEMSPKLVDEVTTYELARIEMDLHFKKKPKNLLPQEEQQKDGNSSASPKAAYAQLRAFWTDKFHFDSTLTQLAETKIWQPADPKLIQYLSQLLIEKPLVIYNETSPLKQDFYNSLFVFRGIPEKAIVTLKLVSNSKSEIEILKLGEGYVFHEKTGSVWWRKELQGFRPEK